MNNKRKLHKSRKSSNREMKSIMDMLKRISLKSKKSNDVMINMATVLRNASDFIDRLNNRPKLLKFPTGGILYSKDNPAQYQKGVSSTSIHNVTRQKINLSSKEPTYSVKVENYDAQTNELISSDCFDNVIVKFK